MPAVFMSHPMAVLKSYQAGHKMPMNDFEAGRLAVALEMLTQLKVLKELPLTELTVQLEAAFMAFLVDQDLIDRAELWYDRLDAWRAPKFVNAEGVGGEPSKTRSTFGASSLASSGEGDLARIRRYQRLLEGRQSLGDLASDGSGELSDEGA